MKLQISVSQFGPKQIFVEVVDIDLSEIHNAFDLFDEALRIIAKRDREDEEEANAPF